MWAVEKVHNTLKNHLIKFLKNQLIKYLFNGGWEKTSLWM